MDPNLKRRLDRILEPFNKFASDVKEKDS